MWKQECAALAICEASTEAARLGEVISSHIGTVSCLGYPSFNEVSMFGNVEQLLWPGWPSGRPSGWGQCCSLARQGWGEFKNYDRDRNYDKGKDYDSNRNHDKGKNNFKGKTITKVKPMTNAKTIQYRQGHCKCKNRDKKRHNKKKLFFCESTCDFKIAQPS